MQCPNFFFDYSPLVQMTLLSSAGSSPAQSFHEALHIPLLPAQILFIRIKQDQKEKWNRSKEEVLFDLPS